MAVALYGELHAPVEDAVEQGTEREDHATAEEDEVGQGVGRDAKGGDADNGPEDRAGNWHGLAATARNSVRRSERGDVEFKGSVPNGRSIC